MNHKELKKAYIKLYSAMMKYIWPVNTVELLAELETSVCNVFPIMSDVRNNFRRLRADVAADLRDDEDMKKAAKRRVFRPEPDRERLNAERAFPALSCPWP